MKVIHSLITICDFTFNEFVILTLSERGLISQINDINDECIIRQK